MLFLSLILLSSCEFFSKIGSKNKETPIVENASEAPTSEKVLNQSAESEQVEPKLETESIENYIKDAAIMANIKSFNSMTSSIICEIVLYVIPKEINEDVAVDFLITNESYSELYFDTTIFLNKNMKGVSYNPERNFYEINLGAKKIGKNFIAKVELPHLTENNSMQILPNQFETIFMNR